MSMTSELVKELRELQDNTEIDCYGIHELNEVCRHAADTIEELSAKLHNSQMERSSQYYHNGWIPCDERLPVVDKESNTTECMLVTDGHLIWMAYYVPNHWVFADCTNSNTIIDWTDIIAWMPLPKPYKPITED